MVTAIDTSILIDVLINDPNHATHSKAALRQAASEGSLIICEIVLAEAIPAIEDANISLLLSDWNLTLVPSTQESAVLAGKMFKRFLQRGGKAGRVVADFIIGAHAQTHAQRLLARDYGFYRDYFKSLKIWNPKSFKV